MPRQGGTAAPAEGDYLQVTSEHLIYRDDTGAAAFRGRARVSLLEGWLEAGAVEVDLTERTRAVAEVRAAGGVSLSLERDSAGRSTEPVLATADRMTYRPAERVLRLHGERAPASVRRLGRGGGTTTGRLLTYHLDSGALDVESGDQTPGRIRTGGP
jgi:lipopolysaccharide export system protein LptA